MSCHAEIAAIKKLPRGINMSKIKLIVVRKGMRMSKPCENCEKVIKCLGIKKVYYSCDGELVKLRV